MGSHSTVAKRYIRCISDALYGPRRTKAQIVAQIREGVKDYLLQNPDADFEMLQTHFGTPQQIAASCVNEQDAFVLLQKMRIKKKMLALVAGVMAAVLLLWFGYINWAAYQANTTTERFLEVIVELK